MDATPPTLSLSLSLMPGHLIRRLHQHSTQVFAAAMAEACEDLTPVHGSHQLFAQWALSGRG